MTKLYENENLEIWCKKHKKFHSMGYDYLVSLIPDESHSV